MKFVTFESGAGPKPGLLLADVVIDIPAAVSILAGSGSALKLPEATFASLLDIIEAGEPAIAVIKQIAASADQFKKAAVPVGSVKLLAPIPRTRKNVFCVGRNYVDHVTEGYKARKLEIKIPEYPQFFSKPATTIIGPGDEIPFDSGVTVKVDYEVELAVVMSKKAKNVSEADAFDYVFGYTIVNDITGRDLQRRHDQWFKGKSLDGSCPMGPCLVYKDEIPDPQDIKITLDVNGETRQSARTSQMIFSLRRVICELSHGLTLDAGDIIATGTPSGVGYAMEDPQFLKPGDVVTCEIEKIGTLVNTIARDSAR
jgi:2-keto-4-pentenoate hydratase/2-oxohepta-3-ene-1,7-dioic acid hydratase in catechol pathway